jgi:DNA-directed RNA polymerase subunit K/omega
MSYNFDIEDENLNLNEDIASQDGDSVFEDENLNDDDDNDNDDEDGEDGEEEIEDNDDEEDDDDVEKTNVISSGGNQYTTGGSGDFNDNNDDYEGNKENSDYDNEDDDNDETESDDEDYFKKFDNNLNKNYVKEYHPECIIQNYDEVLALSNVIRDKDGIIIDELHKTISYLTKYEKTKIIGYRANQINNGSKPYITLQNDIIDGYIIANEELKQKRIPYIIRRPLVGGKVEFWKISDLEQIDF